MNNTSINISTVILMIVLLMIEIEIFGNLFPWTGLKAIIVIPMIYGICLAIIILGTFLTRKANFKLRTSICLAIFLINSLIAAHMYPQEFRPTVLKQIGYTFNVVKNYKTISKEDLELYREDKYYPYDKSVPDDRERYIAALYKFKDKINRDGSNFLYGEKNKPISKNMDIESHLETGQDKLIWWLLRILKNG
jgi:ABC-type multidrug transport system permease subunit